MGKMGKMGRLGSLDRGAGESPIGVILGNRQEKRKDGKNKKLGQFGGFGKFFDRAG